MGSEEGAEKEQVSESALISRRWEASVGGAVVKESRRVVGEGIFSAHLGNLTIQGNIPGRI